MGVPIVSIIIPCYNGEQWIARMLESILNQTYMYIEVIVVNDGSTDNSESIIKAYETKFVEKGMIFQYFYQSNSGLGAAINTGLKAFTGQYLCWADADDYLEISSVQKRVEFLERESEYAIISSGYYIRDYDKLDIYTEIVSGEKFINASKRYFELLLDNKGIFCSGCHMIRTSAFLDVNPKREIYPARRGQNWQMLLPIYYKYKGYFLKQPLYNYIQYPSSMAKNIDSKEFMLERYNEHENILMYTLKMIEENQAVELGKYYMFIKKKYEYLRMNVAVQYDDATLFSYEFQKAKRRGRIGNKVRLLYLRSRFKWFNKLYLFIRYKQ